MPAPSPVQPAPDPLDALTVEVRATRDALLAAARATDWDAIGALIPTEGLFTFSYGTRDRRGRHYESLEEDVAAFIVELLEGDFAQLGEIVVWPALHARTLSHARCAGTGRPGHALRSRRGRDVGTRERLPRMAVGITDEGDRLPRQR